MPRGDVSAVRCVPGGRRPVLRGLRCLFGAAVPVVWRAGLAGKAFLSFLRALVGWCRAGVVHAVGIKPAAVTGRWSGGGAASVLGAVL